MILCRTILFLEGITEVNSLLAYFSDELEYFQNAPEKADAYLNIGNYDNSLESFLKSYNYCNKLDQNEEKMNFISINYNNILPVKRYSGFHLDRHQSNFFRLNS